MENNKIEYKIEFKESIHLKELIFLLRDLNNKGFGLVKGKLCLTIEMSEIQRKLCELRASGYTNNEKKDEALLTPLEMFLEEN